MTFINIEAYAKLNSKYYELVEYHARKLYESDDIQFEIAITNQERTLKELKEEFKSEEIAHDIYLKFIAIAKENGWLWKEFY